VPRARSHGALLGLTLGFVVLGQLGAHLDGWSHVHYGFAIESFWTWPHLVLYAGKAGTGLVVLGAVAGRLAGGAPRGAGLPRGYALVLAGSGLFLVGGAFDAGWHAWVGFEVDVATLLSPAHLWLWVATLVVQAGVLQAALAWRRPAVAGAGASPWADVPVLLALGLFCRVTMWNLVYADPLAIDYAAGATLARRLPGFAAVAGEGLAGQAAGTTGMVLHAVWLVLFLVVPLRHWRLPGGAIAAVMLWNGLLTVAMTDMWRYLPAVAAGALAGEAVWSAMRRGELGGREGEAGYRLLAFVVPAVQFAAYLGLVALVGGGLAWPVHLAAGAPLLAGLYGVIASGFAIPPRALRAS
jgi:hypothetical protein